MGRLDVRVVEAKNLPSAKTFGHLDPYVIVRCENEKFKTTTMHDTESPRWNEDFKVDVIDEKSAQLLVQVWNKSTLVDEMIGEDRLPLSELVRGEKKDKWFSLKHCKSPGEIHLCLTPEDFGRKPPENVVLDKLSAAEVRVARSLNDSLAQFGSSNDTSFRGPRLYRNKKHGSIFLLMDGVLRHLPNPQVGLQLFGRAIPHGEMIGYKGVPQLPVGPPLPEYAQLFRYEDQLYMLDSTDRGRKMRRLIQPTAWSFYGFTTNPLLIRTWSKEEFQRVIEGPEIA
jgi:hypothetical protein